MDQGSADPGRPGPARRERAVVAPVDPETHGQLSIDTRRRSDAAPPPADAGRQSAAVRQRRMGGLELALPRHRPGRAGSGGRALQPAEHHRAARRRTLDHHDWITAWTATPRLARLRPWYH